jgi:thiol-disulfide isomerase/thioredoxin
MKFYLLIILSPFLMASIFAQNSPISDSAYLNELLNSFQKNIGNTYVKFEKKSLTGKRYSERELKGKVTLINFWFESCAPCIAEFDALNKLYKKYKSNENFQFISFTTDSDNSAKLTAQKFKLKFPIICISEKDCQQLNYKSGFPTNIVVDKTGKIFSIDIGGSLDKQIVKENIKKIESEIAECLK